MQMRALEVFVEIARSDSLRQAAQRLGITPTAIGRHVDQLEYHFRAKLIDRSSGGIGLTEAGRLLADRAQSIVVDAESTRALIDDLRGLRRGSVSVRAGGAVVAGLLAPALCDLHARHPSLRFHIDVASAGNVFAAVAEGTADIGVTIFSPESSKVVICQSARIAHAVIVSPGHPLAARPRASMRELALHTLAIPDLSFGLRQALERTAKACSVKLSPVFVTGSLDMQKELAIRGAAALVLPPLGCQREIASGLLVAVPLAEDSTIETSLDLCTAPDRTLSFAAKALLDVLAGYITTHIIGAA